MRGVDVYRRVPDSGSMMEWSWAGLLQWIVAGGSFGAVGGIVTTWLRTRPALVKAETERDTALLDRALTRLDHLEARYTGLELELQKERTIRLSEREKCDAELRVIRHELANEIQAADAFLMLTERDPDKLMENIAQIKEYRERKRSEIALEKGAMLGARSGGSEI